MSHWPHVLYYTLNFIIISWHVGQGGFDVNNVEMDGNWKKLLDLVGVTEAQMQKKETMDFIYDFVEKRGGIKKVTREIELERKSDRAAPAPAAPSRGQSRGPPPPPAPSSGAPPPRPPKLRGAPPRPPPSLDESPLLPPPSPGILPPPPPMGTPTPPLSPPVEGAPSSLAYHRGATRDQSQWRQSSPDASLKKLRTLGQRNKELKEKMNQQNEKSQEKVQKLEQRNEELNHQNERYKQEIEELEKIRMQLQGEILEQRRKLHHADQLDRYEMGEAPRGICLVINNFNFLGEEQRQGAQADEEAIARLFNDLHFKVEIRQNLGGLGILKVAQEMAARDHRKYAAFVFFIMSQGDKKDVIYGVDNRKAGMEDIMSEFTPTNCPALENKPKLFFIQACRGEKSDSRIQRLSASTENIAEDNIQMIHSPDADIANGLSAREADFLLAFSTVPGYKAWRSKQAGSWFIQVLVDVIRQYHTRHHLLDMLTEVNKRVGDLANDYPDVDLSFQVPCPTHTLRAQVFL